MGRIHGVTVALTVKTQIGTDPLGAPIYSETTETVENVLVSPASAQEIVDTLNLTGKRAVYTLAIPKGDAHQWEDTNIQFFGRTFRAIGPVTEGIEALIPLDWNRKVQVEYIGN